MSDCACALSLFPFVSVIVRARVCVTETGRSTDEEAAR